MMWEKRKNEHVFDTLTRKARKEVYRTQNNPPEIEEISKNEVYLLDSEGRRTKRICGKIDSEGWACTAAAGSGTMSEGSGRCARHSKEVAGQKGYLERLAHVLSEESSLKQHVKPGQKQTVEDLVDLLSGFLSEQIDSNQFTWSSRDMKNALMIVKEIRALIDTSMKQEQKRINAKVVLTVIKEFMQIVNNYVNQETMKRIATDVQNIKLPKEIEDADFEVLE